MGSVKPISFNTIKMVANGVRSLSSSTSTFKPAGPLKLLDLNKLTLEAKYAVRGKIPIRADQLKEKISNNPESHGLPFDKIISANIGNPQQLDQTPLTWYRQVLALLQYPQLLQTLGPETANKVFPEDVRDRAAHLLEDIGSLGAYSNSQGSTAIRKSVANFISERDGYASDPNNIFLTGGASAAVQYLLQILSSDSKSGFLIPIPQYPLYTATIALNDAVPIGYYLDEANNWSTNPEQIKQLIEENRQKGVNVKCLVVINPGNPTGAILSKEDIKQIIDIAAEYGLVLIADEVYQENVFEGEFISMKKVLSELLEASPKAYSHVQLASLHSTSKGVSGECGQRGGYMELSGFTGEVKQVIFKLASINLCSVVSGQALMELMINPPKPGDASYELYKKETSTIHDDLSTRSTYLYEAFNKMEDIKCNRPMGAMYLYPRLDFTPEKYGNLYKKAEESELLIDELYCIELLENTGICCVPGSGFGQVPGTHHLRTTFLPPGKDWIERWTKFHENFVKTYKD